MHEQVLSETVATALRTHFRSGEADMTAEFVEMFDKLFDTLNVRNYTTYITKRKPFPKPYKEANDFRLKVHTITIVIIQYSCSSNPCSG